MFRNRELVRKAVARVSRAAKDTLSDLEHGRVQQEPSVTDRLLANIQQQLNGKTLAGVYWSAVTLPDRGPKSAESQLGADFLAVVRFELAGFAVSKGFLAQAKLAEPAKPFSASESSRLRSQCKNMLSISPDSFVFIYSLQSGVMIVPAINVVAARACNPHELTAKTVKQFFTDHFECFIGDAKFAAATGNELGGLLAEYKSRKALFLHGKHEQQ